MKIKFVLIAVALVMMFAACGNREPAVTETDGNEVTDRNYEPGIESDTTYEPSENGGEEFGPSIDPDSFENALDELVVAYDGLVEVLEFMVEELHGVETDEELTAWREAFEMLHNYVGLTAEILTEISDIVPEDHADYFESFCATIDMVYEAMAELDATLSVTSSDDEAAILSALEVFENNLTDANVLIRGE